MTKAERGPQSRISFEEPPPPRQPAYDWAKIREQLKANPMQWAKVFENDKASLVTAIRLNGIVAMRRDRGIEIRTTNNVREPERTCTLWARYVPEKDQTEGAK